jgi:hypothetical protein
MQDDADSIVHRTPITIAYLIGSLPVRGAKNILFASGLYQKLPKRPEAESRLGYRMPKRRRLVANRLHSGAPGRSERSRASPTI